MLAGVDGYGTAANARSYHCAARRAKAGGGGWCWLCMAACGAFVSTVMNIWFWPFVSEAAGDNLEPGVFFEGLRRICRVLYLVVADLRTPLRMAGNVVFILAMGVPLLLPPLSRPLPFRYAPAVPSGEEAVALRRREADGDRRRAAVGATPRSTPGRRARSSAATGRPAAQQREAWPIYLALILAWMLAAVERGEGGWPSCWMRSGRFRCRRCAEAVRGERLGCSTG